MGLDHGAIIVELLFDFQRHKIRHGLYAVCNAAFLLS